MKKQISFIVNPFSGTSKKGNLQDVIAKYLDHRKYEYNILYTEAPGHATTLAATASAAGSHVVVAVGGDGSVNEVAKALIHTDTVLGVLPGGSGNGFAMHAGLGRNIAKAIGVLNSGQPKVIDTCTVNDRFFINVAGLGFDARIAYMTKQNSKRGFMPYFMTTLSQATNYKPLQLSIEIDGRLLEGHYAMATVANATMFGYYFTIAPTALLDDGLLDLVLIKNAPLYRYAASSYRFLNGSLHRSRITECYQGRHIVIKSATADFLHVDGEGVIAPVSLDFRVVPNSLRVLFPA